MKLLVLSVGRPDRSPFAPIFDDYADRIRRFGVSLQVAFVPEVASGGRFDDAHAREREARSLSDALPKRSRVIALDPTGATLSSTAFASRLETWSSPVAAFVVGGPLGLDPEFRASASEILSLSPMTLPHDLARLILAEQLFRALTILKRVPYHK